MYYEREKKLLYSDENILYCIPSSLLFVPYFLLTFTMRVPTNLLFRRKEENVRKTKVFGKTIEIKGT